jgi:hypothetical protein
MSVFLVTPPMRSYPDNIAERNARACRLVAIFGAAVLKGCIWPNFWRNGATQKWRHRVFLSSCRGYALSQVC